MPLLEGVAILNVNTENKFVKKGFSSSWLTNGWYQILSQ